MLKFEEYLTEIGLTEIQITVYKYVLSFPGSGITEISEKLKINRSHVYSIAKKLIDLQIIYEDSSSKMLLYPNDVEEVGNRLNEKRLILNKKYDDFSSNILSIKEFVSTGSIMNPTVQVYHGDSAKSIALRKLINESNRFSKLYLMTNLITHNEIFTVSDHEEFTQRSLEYEIELKVLAVDNKEGREVKMLDQGILRETRFMSKQVYFESEIYLIKNTVLFVEIKSDISCVIIESEQMSKIYRGLFESTWERSLP